VDEAIRLTDCMDRTLDQQEWQEAAIQAGRLLGYPDCCARAFAARPHDQRYSYTLLRLMLRLAEPGEIAPELNPAAELIEWIPCSPACPSTLEQAAARLALIREHCGREQFAHTTAALRNPWLILVDQENAAIELLPDGDPSRSFSYRTGTMLGQHPLLRQVAAGDRLEFDEQRLCVLGRGRLLAALGGRAYIWWYRAPLQGEFWQALLGLRFLPRRCERGWVSQADESPPGSAVQLANRVRELLRTRGRPREYAGFRLVSVEPAHTERACVTLASPRARLRVLVAPRERVSHAYAVAGSLVLMYPSDEPPDSPAKQAALRELARELRACQRQPSRPSGRSPV
jgi:hypothetical protein